MDITIKEEGKRFGVRVCSIILNEDKTMVLLQKQKGIYMFPGGRIKYSEDSQLAIKRELKEELGINKDPKLIIIQESFIKFTNTNYHEIGFYYLTYLNENKYKYGKIYNTLDDNTTFNWVKIKDLNKYNLIPNNIKNMIINNELDNDLRHLIYREF